MRRAVMWVMCLPLALILVMGAGLAMGGALHASWWWLVASYLSLMGITWFALDT